MKRGTKILFLIITILVILAIIAIVIYSKSDNSQLKTIKSEKQLLKICRNEDYEIDNGLKDVLTMPFSVLYQVMSLNGHYRYDDIVTVRKEVTNDVAFVANGTASSTKDYSTTNIQVENVDEADIIKTDGDYIYSISDTNVIITNVNKPEEIKIESTIKLEDGSMPEEIIIYKDELVIISTKFTGTNTYSYYFDSNTVVSIYNLKDKSNPILVKRYELYEPYYTSRCIDNNLYVISAGNLREENKKVLRTYTENSVEKKIDLNNIKYLKDIKTNKQALISMVDLNNTSTDVDVSSFLIDISNAYVSENNIYLLNQKYDYKNDDPTIKDMFGLKGVFGLFLYEYDYDYVSRYNTEIYKFNILDNGKITYNTKNKIEGKTINQYSLDEKDNHLRIALYDGEGSRVAIFDENLKKIGVSDYVAKGETMYSSRFIGNKAYFVTYKTMDPLFVIDLSDETSPKILGELKIPGYSTYLHPYDENHLIGIGMETEEIFNRNSAGKIISTTSRITGMKMALFDVSNVNNPIQISQTVIGDRRTTSAILTNPKALLFSKSKNLIAIPVNNYNEDFEVNSSEDTYFSYIDSYKNYNKKRVGEGYFVYNIDIENGFNLKGVITHDEKKTDTQYYYYDYNPSKLLRGLYIENNLFTVSEEEIKVNKLDTLELVSELKILN